MNNSQPHDLFENISESLSTDLQGITFSEVDFRQIGTRIFMGPKTVAPQTSELFRQPLPEQINMKHPLVRLSELIGRDDITQPFAVQFASEPGRPALLGRAACSDVWVRVTIRLLLKKKLRLLCAQFQLSAWELVTVLRHRNQAAGEMAA